MLNVFGQGRQVLTVSVGSLPSEVAELKQHLLSLVGDRHYQFVQLYDQVGLPVNGTIVEPFFLSYAVMASSEESAALIQPIKVTLRKTDRTGHILFKHPQTTAQELKQEIEILTGVPVGQQELIHRGQRVDQCSLTLESLDFLKTPILHLIDLSQKEQDTHKLFPIFVQTTQVSSKAREFIVSGSCLLGELKSSVSQTFEIPPENLLVTYCGKLLYRDDATLYDCDFVPGAYINVLQQKKATNATNSVIAIDSSVKSTKTNSPQSLKENQNTANTANTMSFSITSKQPEIRKISGRSVFGFSNTTTQ